MGGLGHHSSCSCASSTTSPHVHAHFRPFSHTAPLHRPFMRVAHRPFTPSVAARWHHILTRSMLRVWAGEDHSPVRRTPSVHGGDAVHIHTTCRWRRAVPSLPYQSCSISVMFLFLGGEAVLSARHALPANHVYRHARGHSQPPVCGHTHTATSRPPQQRSPRCDSTLQHVTQHAAQHAAL